MLHPGPKGPAAPADAPVEPTDPGRRALAEMSGPRELPDPPPPWADLAAAGWCPSPGDVRRGFASAVAGRPAEPKVPASRASAILILVCPGPNPSQADDAHVVLIERSHSAGTHRGDIAFPGGVLQDVESPAQAALRETFEEIGVPPGDIEIVASLDMVATLTSFLISPFVGVARTCPAFVVDRTEVERVLVVPLADLLREDAHWYQRWNSDPSSVQPFFAVGDAVGWGTTGALLVHLLTVAAAGHRMEER